MGILVGFHVEGWDHLILRSFVAVLLGAPEEDVVPDWIDGHSRGWGFVLKNLGVAIQRFYFKGAALAVIGVDNDGNEDLTRTGRQEDVYHPRHWNHPSPHDACRVCQVEASVATARARLRPLPERPPATWPVVVAVPVEAIEAWVLQLLAIVDPARGLARAEDRLRSRYKEHLYKKPVALRQDVERVALPLISSASPAQIDELRRWSRSFDMFAEQVARSRALIRGLRDEGAPGM